MPEYDNIAEKYSIREDPIRDFVSTPTLLEVLRNIKGKDILDVGCGSGFITRKMKLLGANNLIAIDISSKMIKLAEEIENQNPLGIKYFIEDISKMREKGEFDIVTATFLLHYSKTKEELKTMCKNIFSNLKRGGRLLALNMDPLSALSKNKKYGAILTGPNPLKEGDEIKITHFDKNNNETFSFKVFHWSKETYESALINAGFKQIEWHLMKVSEEGLKKFGKEYWDEYLSEPRLTIIEAIK